MGVPVTPEDRLRIEAPLLAEEFLDARMAGDELPRIGPAVLGQVVASAELDGPIDQPAEVGRRLGNALGRVLDMKVENDAGPALACPRQYCLVVSFDDANRAVDDVDAVLPCIGADRLHEGRE